MVNKETVIDIKPSENKIKKYFLPAVLLLALILTPLLIGFGLGKYTNLSDFFKKEENGNKSASREGWYIFETSKYSFEYPKGWEIKENPDGDQTGATITGEGGRVEFWFDTDRSYKFTEKQKKEQKDTKTSSMKVDGRSTKLEEFDFKSGDFFLITEVATDGKKPKITIWANAANPGFKQNVSDIITTIKTKSDSN